jgi:hypothetical protein
VSSIDFVSKGRIRAAAEVEPLRRIPVDPADHDQRHHEPTRWLGLGKTTVTPGSTSTYSPSTVGTEGHHVEKPVSGVDVI